jgi:hypothetical protein
MRPNFASRFARTHSLINIIGAPAFALQSNDRRAFVQRARGDSSETALAPGHAMPCMLCSERLTAISISDRAGAAWLLSSAIARMTRNAPSDVYCC